jgi:hypothetical protein
VFTDEPLSLVINAFRLGLKSPQNPNGFRCEIPKFLLGIYVDFPLRFVVNSPLTMMNSELLSEFITEMRRRILRFTHERTLKTRSVGTESSNEIRAQAYRFSSCLEGVERWRFLSESKDERQDENEVIHCRMGVN